MFHKTLPRKLVVVLLTALICSGQVCSANAAIRTWIGGNADWDTDPNKWNPADEPDDDDTAVFNTPNSVDLAIASQTILELTMSNGILLDLNGNDLTVNGPVTLSGDSTDLYIPSGSLLQADAITINSGADITLQGGQVTVIEESGAGVLDVNDGAELSGNGIIQFSDAVSAGTQLFNLDGELSAHSTAFNDILSLAAATLTINVADVDGLIDLDGNDGFSRINVLRNDTLAINGGVLDSAYSGELNLSAGATFSRNVAWSVDGTVNANTGGSDAATIAGATLTQTGGSINVDAGESLRFSSMFHATSGAIVNNGLVIFNNDAEIENAAQFQTGAQGSIEINNGQVIVEDQGWDWDGNGGLDNRMTINDSAALAIFAMADDSWDGAMYLNGGTLGVYGDGTWAQSGGLISVGGAEHSYIIADGPGFLFSMTGGAFNVAAPSTLRVITDSAWSGGTLNVDGLLSLEGDVTWNGAAAVTGGGAIHVEGASVVAANTTINVQTFDWDGSGSSGNVHTINSGVTFTLNISDFDALDNDMGAPINLGGNGAQLIMNGPSQWVMNDAFTANTAGAGTATIGGTSRMVLGSQGTLHVNGNTTVNAPITFDAGSTTLIDELTDLRLSGGNLTTDPNRIEGGTITTSVGGFLAGFLKADGGSALHGYGTLDRLIVDFDDSANLLADDGMLTLDNVAIADVNVLGTADSYGILNILDNWNTGTNIASVEMQGGEIRGGTITNDNPTGISGHGRISARVINNTRIDAVGGPFLRVDTAGDDNDWDGTTNAGSLNAVTADLQLFDASGSSFPFSGTVSASNGYRVSAGGFELDFQPGSALVLTGGTYTSSLDTHVGGAVVVNAGADSRIILTFNTLYLESTSTTTLNGNLQLSWASNAVVRAGATFSGGGALMVVDGAGLFPDNAANINVLIDNAGDFGAAGAGVGRVDARDFQQGPTGELLVDLAGTQLNEYDRLVVGGGVQLGGGLDVSLLNGFLPAQGDTFTVVSALSLSGAFSDIPSGSRVNVSSGGIGSLQVDYGPGSPFGANQLVLSDFQEVVYGTGDYDGNFVFECADVDALVEVIAAGTNNRAYDLTDDGLVDGDDLDQWLTLAGAANLPSGNPYLPADANLDGGVDGVDFAVWNSNKFTSLAAFCGGDFNADGVVDGLDFGIWNQYKFTSSFNSPSVVPEPALGAWILLVTACLAGRSRTAKKGEAPLFSVV
jgi:hypothetical protein